MESRENFPGKEAEKIKKMKKKRKPNGENAERIVEPSDTTECTSDQEFYRLSKAVIISCILEEEEQQGFTRRTSISLPGNIGSLPK